MKENLNKLRDMNKDDVNSQTNVVKSVEGKDNLFFAVVYSQAEPNDAVST